MEGKYIDEKCLLEGTKLLAECVDDAAVLTGIGMGTAFGLLIVLMASTMLMGWLVAFYSRRFGSPDAGEPGAEERAKAMAAAIAVGAVLEGRQAAAENESDGGPASMN